MRHHRLMKYPKRFCVDCSREQYVTVKDHQTFLMYHCQECKAEICRTGDGSNKGTPKRVAGGLDINSFSTDFIGGKSSEVLASEYPDVLSDEHAMWKPRDPAAEAEREDLLRTFKVVLSSLTARQAQVLEAVNEYGTHGAAALSLGITRQVVTKTMKDIEKKLAKLGCFPGEGEIQGGLPQ